MGHCISVVCTLRHTAFTGLQGRSEAQSDATNSLRCMPPLGSGPGRGMQAMLGRASRRRLRSCAWGTSGTVLHCGGNRATRTPRTAGGTSENGGRYSLAGCGSGWPFCQAAILVQPKLHVTIETSPISRAFSSAGTAGHVPVTTPSAAPHRRLPCCRWPPPPHPCPPPLHPPARPAGPPPARP